MTPRIPRYSILPELHLTQAEYKTGRVMAVPKSTFFDDLGHNFHTEILGCPKCGEVYLPEALVKGRMADVERELEDK